MSLTATIKAAAAAEGFTLAGVCPAVSPAGIGRFDQWLAAGFAGEMSYLADRRTAYEHPRHVLDGVRSIVMLGMNYFTGMASPAGEGQGRIARYAWGTEDYHDLIHTRLKNLIAAIHVLAPDSRVRGVVDTAPLLEREFAQLAGLGWVGKNTLLLNKQQGSYFFLAALLTDLELEYDEPFPADHCGTCRACLDACPTQAFPQPYVLDATRCISYLTIELRESIPLELRSGVGEWLFGCDVCQEVCPWNRRAPHSPETAFAPKVAMNPIDLIALFDLDDDAFRTLFRRTPLWRSKRRGILRNAAIVLGNRPTPRAVDALVKGLRDDEPLIRGACAWALGHYKSRAAQLALGEQSARESDAQVVREITEALAKQNDATFTEKCSPTPN
jgi:epoxyqueuosine reductase